MFLKMRMDQFIFAYLTKFKEVASDLSGTVMTHSPTLFTLVKAISAQGHQIPEKEIIYSTTMNLRASELLTIPELKMTAVRSKNLISGK